MAEVESFVELGLRKYKFDSSKTKKMSNDGGDHEGDRNGNGGNGKNGGNEKPPNRKWKPNNRLKGPIKCFLCD
ncbi:hypothetical protein Goklo_017622, partial [Gossypium klotzschianum]|nr:hypothetical protein [Gossypium klotzschianum]